MRSSIAMLTLAGLMAFPVAARALDERVWLVVHGGGGTYAMSTVNAEIDDYNAAYGGNFEHIEGGRSFGGAAGFETTGRWNYGVGFDRLDAKTRSDDASGSVEYQFGANAWRFFSEYSLRPLGQSTIYLGGAVGIVQEHGKITLTAPGYPTEEYKTIGNGLLLEGYAGGSWWMTGQLGLTATVGYRHARVKEPKFEGGYPMTTASGEPLTMDFSGPTARVGIKLATRGIQ